MNTELNSASGANNDSQMQSALDSIAVIRQMIDRTEVNMKRLGALFLAYGIINLAQTVLKALFGTFYLNSGNSVDSLANKANLYSIVAAGMNILTWTVLLAIFFIMRKRMQRTESSYTMKLFDMWGIMMFLPLFLEAAYALTRFIPLADTDAFWVGSAVLNLLRSGAVCMCLFFTGHYTGNWAVKAASLVLLMLIPLSCAADMSWLTAADISTLNNLSVADIYQYLMVRAGYINCILMVVYIIMGVIFLVKREGRENGAQQDS